MCCYPPTCKVCGNPSSYCWSGYLWGFCSFRCNAIGLRYLHFISAAFIMIIAITMFSFVMWPMGLFLILTALFQGGLGLYGVSNHGFAKINLSPYYFICETPLRNTTPFPVCIQICPPGESKDHEITFEVV